MSVVASTGCRCYQQVPGGCFASIYSSGTCFLRRLRASGPVQGIWSLCMPLWRKSILH